VGFESEDKRLPLLHIDDDARERQLVREAIFLSDTPFAYFEADQIEAAIPFFQSANQRDQRQYPRPALVLLDYDLGEHTGVDFLYWLRSLKKVTSIPVVMFSSSVNKSNLGECYANGASYFLNKPNSLSRLKLILEALYKAVSSPQPRPNPIMALAEYMPDPRTKPAPQKPSAHPASDA
jgi:CheY-like chemotaxis protein